MEVAGHVRCVSGINGIDLEAWRKAGYAAIDTMIESLGQRIVGNERLEEVSSMLEKESKNVTAAVFGTILDSLGKEELKATTCICPECGQTLRSPRNLRRTVDTQYGRLAFLNCLVFLKQRITVRMSDELSTLVKVALFCRWRMTFSAIEVRSLATSWSEIVPTLRNLRSPQNPAISGRKPV